MHCGFFFFFSSRRWPTRLTCDWSSDVCSSDLCGPTLDRIDAVAKDSPKGVTFINVEPYQLQYTEGRLQPVLDRSEERRVGKECRSRWSPEQIKKKKITIMTAD